MTLMLALVGTVPDAATVLAAGADRLVVKAGSAAPLAAIGAAAGGRCPVSLWWQADDGDPEAAAAAASACGADEIWTAGEAPPGMPHRVVIPPGDQASVAGAAARGASGVIVDGSATPGRLLATTTIADLERQRRRAAAVGTGFGISGAMEAPDVPRLLALGPDVLVFDDLLRHGGAPSAPVAAERMSLVRQLMASGPAGALPTRLAETDRIFARDWVLPLRLGAYGHEVAPQRVRFSVEAEVAPIAGRAADMRDVVTYDLIIDAIARATVGHVALVETIAEDVAALILAHPRVIGVDVTVEKLDLGPGSLGCRIKRRRAP